SDNTSLPQFIVYAIAVGVGLGSTDRSRKWACRRIARKAPLPIIERAERAINTRGGRHIGAGLGHDVDNAADGAVAIKDCAGVAPRYLDAFDAVERYGGKVEALQIEVIEPPAI